MKIGLIDVDGHNFPSLALMKISHYHKRMGDDVLWYNMFEYFDKVYMSKVFTFTEDYGWVIGNAGEIVKGGTGYNNNMDLFCEDEPLDLDLYREIDGNIECSMIRSSKEESESHISPTRIYLDTVKIEWEE